ncbi:uncharacterized protein LOC119723459 [Patiria miniata]|uniref:B box-type domain-containing protein n=1 Tax=Patiria miniata TaxID=46514 RepID=A0A913ZE39_PATMI|nr:uncharacterized protein LOC119723459 [Patiria miniata]
MASLRPFNTSTKDAKSFKLRNPQLSSKDTERLDTDNYKMEARLRELKLSMRRQKEERENMNSDGSIWSSGKPGAVTTHGTDLMKKEPSKPTQSKGKARKIKVLKDTPLDLPKRAPIARSFTEASPPKFKGPACGQCEQKAVALTCMECVENYCTTCFAKFHMKGALKNHRSVPFQTNRSSSNSSSLDLSNGMTSSPNSSIEGLPPRPSSASRRTTTSTDTASEQVKTVSIKLKDPSEMEGGAFLQGTFSEEESAQSFAQALAEWRSGKQNGPTEASQKQEVKKESIASGTTTEEPPPIEIKFQQDTSITYADKLLIKKHRRTELSPLPSPRLSSDGEEEKRSPRQGKETLTNGHVDNLSDDENELQEEHQRYVGIFSKSISPSEPRLASALSIVEVTEAQPNEAMAMEVESVYSVQEVDDSKSQGLDQSARGDRIHTSSNRYSPEMPQETQNTQSKSLTSPGKPKTPGPLPAKEKQQQGPKSGNKPTKTVSTPIRGTPDAKHPKQQRSTPQRLDASSRLASAHSTAAKPEKIPSKPKSKSASGTIQRKPLTKSSESRDVHESITPIASDDASGRVSGLTSTPSGELMTASHLVRQTQHHYKAGLGDFFLAGLGNEEGEPKNEVDDNRESTPVNRLPDCSYKGALSAWRPDSSLANPALQQSLKPFSPSPPPKSGRQAHRSAAKSRLVKSINQDNSDTGVRGQSAKVKEERSSAKPRPDADNTISWMLSEELSKRGKGWNNNNNERKGDGAPGAEQAKEPDRSSSRIEVDGDDMTVYDNVGRDDTEMADQETLEQLTWELASHSGGVTADGRLTSMSLPDPDDDHNDDIYRDNSFSQDTELGILEDDGMGSGLSTPFDFVTGESISPEDKKEDADFLEMQRYTAEVQALI